LIIWQKAKQIKKEEPWEERYLQILSGELPSFQFVDREDWQELLRGYLFRRSCFKDIPITSLRICYGRRELLLGKEETSSEMITVLFLLSLLLGQAEKKEKKYASWFTSCYGPDAIFISAVETGFNDIKVVLAFLAKRAWAMNGDIEDYMKNLEALVLEPIY